MSKIKRRLHFYSVKVVDGDGRAVDPRSLMRELSTLKERQDWELALDETRSQGLKATFVEAAGRLEGIAWYDRNNDFPEIANGLDSEPLDTEGRALREKVHFIWWDLSQVEEAMGKPRGLEGCLIWEFGQRAPRIEAFDTFIRQKTENRYSIQITRLTAPGALERLKQTSRAKFVRIVVKDTSLDLPDSLRDGPAALRVPKDLEGLFEIQILCKPVRKGWLGFGSRVKQELGEMTGSQNLQVRVCFEDGIELPLEDAEVVFVAKEVPPAELGAKSVDSYAMLGAIRDAYEKKRDDIRLFFGRNV